MFAYSFWCKPSYSEYGAMYTVVASCISEVIELMRKEDEHMFKTEFEHNIEYLYECIAKGAIIRCHEEEDARIAEYFMT